MKLRACEKIPKPSLSQKNVQERLCFAIILKDRIVEDWKRMVFSDSTKIICFTVDERSWYWINDKENIFDHAVKLIMKHDRRSIMLKCMTIRDLGDL